MTYRINGKVISREEFLASAPEMDFSGRATYAYDADKLLGDGMMNPADGKRYTSRREWNASLRALGYEEVGDQAKTDNSHRQIQGDFNVRAELKQALEQHLR